MKPVTKYRNRKVVVDGLTFDSKAEAAHYQALKVQQAHGEIDSFKRQVRYELIPTIRANDCHSRIDNIARVVVTLERCGRGAVIERPTHYVADFVVRHLDGSLEVQDVKSPFLRKNPLYVLKRKLMLLMHGIIIREIVTERASKRRAA